MFKTPFYRLLLIGVLQQGLLFSSIQAAKSGDRLISIVPRIGVVGDSLSDEYSTYPYGLLALNWVQFLEKSDLGELGSFRNLRIYPRLYGYGYNWARAGSKTSDVLNEGQVPGLMYQMLVGEVEVVVVMIGANDFNDIYDDIYDGVSTETQIISFLDELMANMKDIIEPLASMDPKVMIVSTIPDMGDTPRYRLGDRPDPEKRALVTEIIKTTNQRIRELALENGAVILETFDIFKTLVAEDEYRYHGYRIDATSGGITPDKMFAIDGFHPGSLLQSYLANTILTLIEDERTRLVNETLEESANETPVVLLEPEYHLIPHSTIFGLTDIEPSSDIYFPNSEFTDPSHHVIRSPWFGILAVDQFPWINHAEHGWFYCDGYGGDTVRLWESHLGWLQANLKNYPWFVRESDGHLLLYEKGSKEPRRFWDTTDKVWLQIPYGAITE